MEDMLVSGRILLPRCSPMASSRRARTGLMGRLHVGDMQERATMGDTLASYTRVAPAEY